MIQTRPRPPLFPYTTLFRSLAYLVSLIGDRALAEDLLQQTFLKVHQSRATYVRDANPVPWIYTIAHRTCLDELRKRKRAPVKDRKSTRLNSSHVSSSYAVFC